MRDRRQVIPIKLPTDQGHIIDAWAVVGTAIAYPGQEGEKLARDHAASLDEQRAAQRRRSRDGD